MINLDSKIFLSQNTYYELVDKINYFIMFNTTNNNVNCYLSSSSNKYMQSCINCTNINGIWCEDLHNLEGYWVLNKQVNKEEFEENLHDNSYFKEVLNGERNYYVGNYVDKFPYSLIYNTKEDNSVNYLKRILYGERYDVYYNNWRLYQNGTINVNNCNTYNNSIDREDFYAKTDNIYKEEWVVRFLDYNVWLKSDKILNFDGNNYDYGFYYNHLNLFCKNIFGKYNIYCINDEKAGFQAFNINCRNVLGFLNSNINSDKIIYCVNNKEISEREYDDYINFYISIENQQKIIDSRINRRKYYEECENPCVYISKKLYKKFFKSL